MFRSRSGMERGIAETGVRQRKPPSHLVYLPVQSRPEPGFVDFLYRADDRTLGTLLFSGDKSGSYENNSKDLHPTSLPCGSFLSQFLSG